MRSPGPPRRAGQAYVQVAVWMLVSALLATGSLLVSVSRAGAVLSSTPAHSRFSIPASARELIVVSSATYDPPGYVTSFRTFSRPGAGAPWKPVFPAWQTEIGSGEIVDVRREGDHATPTGVYGFGTTMYGTWANPGGLHEAYHHLVCGDWWDEDPYSPQYNRFVHVACGTTPSFAAWSEPLWEETQGTRGYPYLAVIDYNVDPTIAGADAPGSGIFLHSWMDAPTEGCLALPIGELLRVLRWLEPAKHPVVEIGTDAEVGSVPPRTG